MDSFWRDLNQMRAKGPEAFLNKSTVERYTNKEFLIRDHEDTLRGFQITPFQSSFGITVVHTVTSDIKSSPHTTLTGNNRVDIKAIIASINKPLTGKFLLCRSICPPFKMSAVGTVVDDPDGELCVRLSLYNFIENISSTSSMEKHLPVGTILAIKNPWFKTTLDHGLSVRCDNPADVVILNKVTIETICPQLKWNGEIPLKYRPKEITAISGGNQDWKTIGNDHFASKRFLEAVSAYTNELEKGQLSDKYRVDVLSNRSAAYLALDLFKLALIDAESALTIDKDHIKCIYRKTMALFGLALYDDALEFLNKIVLPKTPENKKIIRDLLIKGKSFIDQSQTGTYPWQEIYKDNKVSLDLAEYKGPVIVKSTPSKGRGLFATKAIEAGELILASKAFAYVIDDDPNEIVMNTNIGKNRMKRKSDTQLVSTIVHILKENPEKCTELYDLYAGPELGYLTSEDGAQSDNLYDMKRIDAICSYNAFGRNRSFEFTYVGFDCAGLWITPSYINHSCADANSSWLQFGNFIFIRAFHSIAAEEEIVITYRSPSKLVCQEELDRYNFVCNCRLCTRDRQDSVQIQSYRAALYTKLDKIADKHMENTRGNTNIINIDAEISQILKLFNDTRKDAPELNFCLVPSMMRLCGCYYYKNKFFVESADHLINVFKVIENVAAFAYVSLEVCVNIIAAFIQAGEIPKAQSWLDVLKTRSVLVYGTLSVIYTRFPSTVKLMTKFRLDVR